MSNPRPPTPGNELSAGQQTAIIEAVDSAAWGVVESVITQGWKRHCCASSLRPATLLTAGTTRTSPWDECSMPEAAIDEMSDELRLAYVGRLARSLALRYGIGLGALGDALTASASSPGGVLRAINDAISLPTIMEEP